MGRKLAYSYSQRYPIARLTKTIDIKLNFFFCLLKIVPVINLTGRMLIRGTTPIFAKLVTLVFFKKQYYFIFHPRFDNTCGLSAPPLSVKCGIQNTSNGSIVCFDGNARDKKIT